MAPADASDMSPLVYYSDLSAVGRIPRVRRSDGYHSPGADVGGVYAAGHYAAGHTGYMAIDKANDLLLAGGVAAALSGLIVGSPGLGVSSWSSATMSLFIVFLPPDLIRLAREDLTGMPYERVRRGIGFVREVKRLFGNGLSSRIS